MPPFLIYDMTLQHSPVYQFSQACLLTCFDESGRNNHTEATFIFRDLKTLANIILVSCGILCILFLWNYLCAVFLWFHQFFFLSFVKDKLDKHLMKITSPRAIWRTILLKVSLWFSFCRRHWIISKIYCLLLSSISGIFISSPLGPMWRSSAKQGSLGPVAYWGAAHVQYYSIVPRGMPGPGWVHSVRD